MTFDSDSEQLQNLASVIERYCEKCKKDSIRIPLNEWLAKLISEGKELAEKRYGLTFGNCDFIKSAIMYYHGFLLQQKNYRIVWTKSADSETEICAAEACEPGGG
jgi:hypothetical protein